MATYKRFEDLPVWQKSADLAGEIFEWTTHSSFRGKGDLANQLQRSTLSVSNNIAEGFERGSTNELLQFLYIARGSAGESRSMLCVMERMGEFDDMRSEISNFKSEFESVSRQLRAWADALQNSDIAGQRHLNQRSRERYERYERHERKKGFFEQQATFRQEMEDKLHRKVEERHRDSV